MAKSSGPLAPRVFAPDLPAVLSPGHLVLRGDFFQASFDDLADSVDASYSTIVESRIGSSSIHDLSINGATLTDVDIETLNVVQLGARESTWRNVRIDGGRIASLNLAGANLGSVELRNLRLDYVNLAGADLADIQLIGCRIATLDLPDARVTRVRFDECTADEVDSRRARIQHLDLRGLEVGRFVDASSLGGATLSERQVGLHAVDFARALGVDVRD